MKVIQFFIKILVFIIAIDLFLVIISNYLSINFGPIIGIINVILFFIAYKMEINKNAS